VCPVCARVRGQEKGPPEQLLEANVVVAVMLCQQQPLLNELQRERKEHRIVVPPELLDVHEGAVENEADIGPTASARSYRRQKAMASGRLIKRGLHRDKQW